MPIFQLVIPAELWRSEETINELLHYFGDGDIVIDHGIATLKTVGGRDPT